MNALNSDNVGTLLLKQSIPTAVGLAVTSLYHLVNMVVVGRGIGPQAIAAIVACFPYVLLQMGIAQCIGIGGASRISRQLGAGDRAGAKKTVGTMLSLGITAGLLLSALTLAAINRILPLLAADGPVVESARIYLSIIAAGAPLSILMIIGNNIARAQGFARRSMSSMFLSSLSIMVLSPLFIFHHHAGIGGAAVAVVIAQGSAALFICGCAFRKSCPAQPSFRDLRLDLRAVRDIVAVGSSAFALQLAAFSVTLFVNHILAASHPTAIAAYGILERLSNLALTSLYGIAYAAGPIIGFNSGLGRTDRVRKTIAVALIAAVGIGTVMWVPFFLIPGPCAALFSTDPTIILWATTALQTATLLFPLLGIHIVGTAIFQALGMARTGFLLCISRQALFLIPLICIFSSIDVRSVFMAWPIADLCAIMLTGTLLWRVFRKLPAGQK